MIFISIHAHYPIAHTINIIHLSPMNIRHVLLNLVCLYDGVYGGVNLCAVGFGVGLLCDFYEFSRLPLLRSLLTRNRDHLPNDSS